MPSPGEAVTTLETAHGTFLVRYPVIEDVDQMLIYINALSRERTYTNMQGEQLTIESETVWLTAQLEGIEAGNVIQLLIIRDDEIVGIAGIRRQTHVSQHIGVLGISIKQAYRGRGLGRALMNVVISEAQKHLEGLRMIALDCFGSNAPAIHLYRSLGFIEYGRLPGGIIQQENEIDRVLMYLSLP